MAQKKFSGKVVAISDTEARASVGIEISPFVKAEGDKPAVPAKTVMLNTNDPELLRGLAVGKKVTVSID